MVDVGNDLGTFVVSPFLTYLDRLLSYLASNVTQKPHVVYLSRLLKQTIKQ